VSTSLQDKVVLITGTAGGQGREAALRFAAAGAHVIGCDINAEGSRETVRLVRARGGRIDAMEPVDLGDPHQARAWIEAAAAVRDRIDILYNNASAARFTPFETFSLEDWHFTVRNELDLVFYATRFAWPWLQRQGGLVINIASVAGIAGSGPGGAAHAATKGAVIALTKQLAMEGAPHGIRVVTISPGFVETPGTAHLVADPQIREQLLGRNLIKRPGQPRDVAGVALFLAGDDAAYITGSNIVVDGGRMAW
jgi:NAD(P)-dependent dehydrogenase (short-subunit alcohol dehydrogenase family)